jgi:adenylosuccinate lyase
MDVSLNPLSAISPVDGRYLEMVMPLTSYFSEFALIRYRVEIEVEYLLVLSAVLPELKKIPAAKVARLRDI